VLVMTTTQPINKRTKLDHFQAWVDNKFKQDWYKWYRVNAWRLTHLRFERYYDFENRVVAEGEHGFDPRHYRGARYIHTRVAFIGSDWTTEYAFATIRDPNKQLEAWYSRSTLASHMEK
jgi:hypothetical protein